MIVKIKDALNWNVGEFVEVEIREVTVTGQIGSDTDTKVLADSTRMFRVKHIYSERDLIKRGELGFAEMELEEWGRL